MDTTIEATCRTIVQEDCYRMNEWPNNYFDFIVDIGANLGVFVMLANMRHPHAKTLAYEPCRSTFQEMKNYTWWLSNVKWYQQALGDGSPLVFYDTGYSYRNVFYKASERPSLVGNDQAYSVESRTLPQIFDDNRIEGKYFIKMDCEGGERFILNDVRCVEIIRNSCVFCVEVHFPPRRQNTSAYDRFKTFPEWNIWDKWIRDNFTDTHSVWYGYSDGKKSGHGSYILKRK